MPRSFVSSTATHHGPTLIGLGLAVVLAAQMFAGIPVAAAIALIGVGSMLTLRDRHMHELVPILNFAMYAGVVAMAIAAQFNLNFGLVTLGDAAAAISILVVAVTRAFSHHG